MENVQRSVILLKPDTHIAGQWKNGATLRLNAVPGGIILSLQGGTDMGEGCSLMLFTGDGSPIIANELTGSAFQTKVSGVQFQDIAGAAVICGDRFLLKSSGLNWPDVIARYRFANVRPAPVPAEPQPTEADHTPEAKANTPEAVGMVKNALPQELPIGTLPEISEEIPKVSSAPPQENEAPLQQPLPQPEEPCPGGIRQSPIDPFPGVFPGSEWVKISYPGPTGWWHYIFGRARVDGYDTDVVGVPGDYGMAPPAWLDGFSAWVRCSSGDARGYWLMFQDAQTGQVLDISRFRHGG